MADAILVSEDNRTTTLTINRPEAKNALNLDALQRVIGALEASIASPTRVVVLRGTGGTLSSGGDIQDMLARRGQAVATFERLRAGLARIVELITGHPKPVVACIDGDAAGAGAAVALSADALLATQRSRIGFPFVKVGLVPDTGASWILPRVAGLQAARRLLLTGDMVPAAEADRMGLVSQVVADTAALEAARAEWVARFADLPATAVRDAKRLLYQSVQLPLGSALMNEAVAQGLRFTTDEHAKAVDAFLAKKRG